MKATRFMRQPFFVKGYKVTLDNMHSIAAWCKGHVVEDGEHSFVRVPVNRSNFEKQTRGYVGMWVTVSKHRGEKSFKVYSEDRLLADFLELPDDDDDTPELMPVSGHAIPSATPPPSNASPKFRAPTPGPRN